jgi:predicted kinase
MNLPPLPTLAPLPLPLPLPTPGLYVLIGAAGSGKTHIASAFPRRWRLSLDSCRVRVCDDAGSQESTPDAVRVFDTVLDARLARRLPTVIDATSTNQADRVPLVMAAHGHQLPAVAIVARTPLLLCLARQQFRAANRKVPTATVAGQHRDVPTREQLINEGFDQVHDASDLDLLRLLLDRAAAAGLDPLADVRATFGDLADVFAFDPDSEDSEGSFAVGGRQLTVRWWDVAEPYEAHWQARVDGEVCACGGALWVKVTGARDLLDVYTGRLPEEPVCSVCDIPDYCTA